MDLKVGDLVAFKKYENMTGEERYGINEGSFPGIGTVSAVHDETNSFKIEEKQYVFSQKSIDYIIVKSTKEKINVGDEVLVKTTVSSTHDNLVWLSPLVFKDNVVKVLKRKEEHFIVREDNYGMYVYGLGVLISNKDDAKIYNSRNEANEEAAEMHLNVWEVIQYDD